MPSLRGARVIRGPDWKNGNEDGGVGNVGTVIDTSLMDFKCLGSRTVTVIWDSGSKSICQAGPKGSHELRVLNSVALGVKHPEMRCDDPNCWVREIWGTRWHCRSCHNNFCTPCFMKKVPHNLEHNQYQRFDEPQTDNFPEDICNRTKLMPIVNSWNQCGPEGRIALKGIFPGAKVVLVIDGRNQEETNIGLVIPNPKEAVSGEVVVQWAKERSRLKRIKNGKLTLKVKELGLGGFIHPDALPLLEYPVANDSRPKLSIGDRVCLKHELKDFENRIMGNGLATPIGTVKKIWDQDSELKCSVEFFMCEEDKMRLFEFNASNLWQINKFSINQFLWIRNDIITIMEIKTKFPFALKNELESVTARVSRISEMDPANEVFIEDKTLEGQDVFDGKPLPSRWFQLAQPTLDNELALLLAQEVDLFVKAVGRGNLEVVRDLHFRQGIDVDALNSAGYTALDVARHNDHQDMVQWLIEKAKASTKKAGCNKSMGTVGLSEDKSASSTQPISDEIVSRPTILTAVTADEEKISSTEPSVPFCENQFGRAENFGSKQLDDEMSLKEPVEVVVQLDKNNAQPLLKDVSSRRMKPLAITQSSHENKQTELTAKHIALFIAAVDANSLDAVKFLYQLYGVGVNALSATGMTALHVACKEGFKDIVQWLLDEFDDEIEKPDVKGFRAIHSAVQGCQIDIIKLLLERGAQLNCQADNGRTPLHVAVLTRNCDECLTLLIKSGCDVNKQDSKGNTPLHLAAAGNSRVMGLLMSSGRINWKLLNGKGLSAIHYIIDSSNNNLLGFVLDNLDKNLMLELILETGPPVLPYVCNERKFKAVKVIVSHPMLQLRDAALLPSESASPGLSLSTQKLLEAKDKSGLTALLISCREKDHSTIELLVESGADVQAVDVDGNTALMLASASLVEDTIPAENSSPNIFKCYEAIKQTDIACGNSSLQSLLLYLRAKGCPWEAKNNAGQQASELLLSKGKSLPICSSTEMLCMDKSGNCSQKATFVLKCPHQPPFYGCSKCVLLCAPKNKCGCVDEDLTFIPSLGALKRKKASKSAQKLKRKRQDSSQFSGKSAGR